jgi:DNA (cytosine-5)-methyltransferase 1
MSYTLVSLFSGAGFLDFGFSENGFKVIWGAELIPHFAEANNYNHQLRYNTTDSPIQAIDITTIDPQSIPRTVGIIGGPPCQDYSIGNAKSPGVSGERGKLVWDFLNKITHLDPDFFLFENVSSLYKVKKHREEALEPLIHQFNQLGYEVYFKVLNTLDYGIPQDRSRVFIVGFKKEIIRKLESCGLATFQWPQQIYDNAKKDFTWPTTNDLEEVVNEQASIKQLNPPYELTVHSVIGKETELTELPNHVYFKPYSNRFQTVLEGDVKRKSFKRLHRYRYSPTVAYGNNEVHLHPTLPRRLSVREALRIQSVPDWYIFEEKTSLDKMFKMISNGVAFKLAELLAIEIKSVLDSYYTIVESEEEHRVTVH